MRTVNKETVLCISVASRPGNLGTIVHNAGYQALGLNFLYQAFGVSNIVGAIAGVRALGIRGCSVSMPFKETVIPCLDDIHETARQVGAVNTVVNSDGVLVGYNTDVTAAQWALEAAGVMVGEAILVLGAGGMARAVLAALKGRSCPNILVANRTAGRAEDFGVEIVPWEERNSVPADILINATPIGMAPDHEAMPVSAQSLSRFRAVIDVVARPPHSRLVAQAEAKRLTAVSGDLLSLQQAMKQFTLYTGEPAPEQAMHTALQGALSTAG